jgi:hypothetical protein
MMTSSHSFGMSKAPVHTAFLYLSDLSASDIEWYGDEGRDEAHVLPSVSPVPHSPASVKDKRSWKEDFVPQRTCSYFRKDDTVHVLRVVKWKDSRTCLFQPLDMNLMPAGKEMSVRMTAQVAKRFSMEKSKEIMSARAFRRK